MRRIHRQPFYASAIAAIAVFLALGAGTAFARATSFSTHIRIDDSFHIGMDPHDSLVFGHVNSSRRRCVADRKVKVFATSPGESPRLVDLARTSDNGGWAARADFFGAGGVKAVAIKTKFGRRHHRKTCRSAKFAIPFA